MLSGRQLTLRTHDGLNPILLPARICNNDGEVRQDHRPRKEDPPRPPRHENSGNDARSADPHRNEVALRPGSLLLAESALRLGDCIHLGLGHAGTVRQVRQMRTSAGVGSRP